MSLLLILALVSVSCKKKHQLVQYDEHPYATAPLVPIDTSKVWGIMYVSRSRTYGDSSVSKYDEFEWTWFYSDDRSSYIVMDTLTFNGNNGNGYCYWPYNEGQEPRYPIGLYYNTNRGANGPCTTFNIDNGIKWVAKNKNAGISIDYDFSGPFPKFINFVPSYPSHSRGLTFTFDSTTVIGADSVMIVVSDSPSHNIIKTVSANQGAVNINLQSFCKCWLCRYCFESLFICNSKA